MVVCGLSNAFPIPTLLAGALVAGIAFTQLLLDTEPTGGAPVPLGRIELPFVAARQPDDPEDDQGGRD